MLNKTDTIDALFWVEGHLESPMTIFAEGGDWNNPNAIENLSKKLQYYQDQITSGALDKRPGYEGHIFKFISLSSKDPIPEEALQILEKKKEELAPLGIILGYRYVPNLGER